MNRIARITCAYPPYKGGIGTNAYNLAKIAAAKGHEVFVFTPDYKNEHPTVEKAEGVTTIWLKPWLKFGNAALCPQILGKLKGYAVVHLQYPFFGVAEFVWLLKLIKGKKMRLVLRYEMDTVGKGWRGLFFRLHSRLIMPLIVRSADNVVVSSIDYLENSNAKKLYNKNPQRFHATGLGVDTKRFFPTPKDEILLGKHDLATTDIVMLIVAGLDRAHYFKGIDLLIKALTTEHLKEKHNLKLLIVGQDGDLKGFYRDLITANNLEDRIKLVGRVDDEELARYYNVCDMFVLPSTDKSEAFGLVFLEANACRKPCIAADLAGVRTVVRDGKNGLLVQPGNLEDLAEKIKILSENPTLRGKMGEEGYQTVQAKYTWEMVSAKENFFPED